MSKVSPCPRSPTRAGKIWDLNPGSLTLKLKLSTLYHIAFRTLEVEWFHVITQYWKYLQEKVAKAR